MLELFTRLRSCVRLIRAAPPQVRISVAPLETVDASARNEAIRAIDYACGRFNIGPLVQLSDDVQRPTAVERTVESRLCLGTLASSWVVGELGVDFDELMAEADARDPMRHFHRQTVTTRRGLRLGVYSYGQGEEARVLVLPYGVPVELCTSLGLAVGKRGRFVAIESPDLTSDPEDFERFRFDPYESPVDIAAVLDHLGLRTVHLTGTCASAMATLRFASEHNARVRSLTIGNGAFVTQVTPRTPYERDFARFVMNIGARRDKARVAHRAVAAQTLSHVDPEYAHLTMLPYAGPGALYMYMASCHSLYANELSEEELQGWCSRISEPVLLISGEHDEVTSASAAHAIADRLPNARVFVEPGGTHLSPLTNPSRELTSEMERFTGASSASD